MAKVPRSPAGAPVPVTIANSLRYTVGTDEMVTVMVTGFVAPDTPIPVIGYVRCGKECWHPVTGVFDPVHTERNVAKVAPASPAPRLIPSMPQNLLGMINAGVPSEEPLPSL